MRVLRKGNSNKKSLAYKTLVFPILEYGSSCWDLYKEGHVCALDRVQKKAAKFANHTNDSVRENLAQSRMIAGVCALFKAWTGERAWKSIGNRLKGQCYLSRDTHDRKFRARKQRTHIGKYCFVNRTSKLWNRLPSEALATFPCTSHIFREGVKKVIISEVKWRVFETWWRNIQKCRKVKIGEWCVVKWSEVMWSEVKWGKEKWSEVKWCEMRRREVKWSGVKGSDVKWRRREVKWSEEKWWSGVKCIIIAL